jgi:hypothetical protein
VLLNSWLSTKNLLNSWSNPGHIFGSCLVVKKCNLVYVNIPKNASTWTKSQLSTLDAEFDNYFLNPKILENNTILITLREPIERWISGISWYLTMHHPDLLGQCEKNLETRAVLMSMIAKKISFDEHCDLQEQFIQKINLDKASFLCVKHNTDIYQKTFSKFFKERLGVDNTFDLNHANHVAMFDPVQNRWTALIQDALSNGMIDQKEILKYYSKDVKLFNNLKFYE